LDPNRLFNVRPDSPLFLKELCTWGISGLSRNIIKETNFEKIKATRRINFEYLLNHFLKNDPGILVFRKLSDGVCPLFFPIILESAESSKRVYESLVSQGIIAFRWWRFHPEVPWDEFPDGVYLKSRLLGLPIHQDLSFVHLDWIIEAFEKAYPK
jgi:dTDP-4-amino-4,6-dideoxygalactose transaminase